MVLCSYPCRFRAEGAAGSWDFGAHSFSLHMAAAAQRMPVGAHSLTLLCEGSEQALHDLTTPFGPFSEDLNSAPLAPRIPSHIV